MDNSAYQPLKLDWCLGRKGWTVYQSMTLQGLWQNQTRVHRWVHCLYLFTNKPWQNDINTFTLQDLGIGASDIHMRSVLHAKTGICGYGILVTTSDGRPLDIKTSTISCRLVSHRTGSPNSTTAAHKYQQHHCNIVFSHYETCSE